MVSAVEITIKLTRDRPEDKVLKSYEKEYIQILPVNVGMGSISR